MKFEDYQVFPLPVFVVGPGNGRILISNAPAQRLGFAQKRSFFEMLEDSGLYKSFVQRGDEIIHRETIVNIDRKPYAAVFDAVMTELDGQAVFLVTVTQMKNALLMDKNVITEQILNVYLEGDDKPEKGFLRVTAKGAGAFCASLYEKKNGRYTLVGEWREERSVFIPMLSADVENAPEKEEMRLRSVKRAADVLIVPYQKKHGTEGLAVYCFKSAAGDNYRVLLKHMAGIYALLSPDAPANAIPAVMRGLDASDRGIAVWDSGSKEILYENKAFRALFGAGYASLLTGQASKNKRPPAGQSTFQPEGSDRFYCISHTHSKYNGRPITTTVVSDVTKYKIAENRLEMLTKTDMLTGLNNRRAGLEILEAAYLRCKKEKKPLTVCFADIDGLKRVNDTYGHGVGDNMIRMAASILKKNMDGTGDICRLGGDEFLLIFPGMTKAQAEMTASRINQAVSKIFVNKSQGISISFGFKQAEYGASETVYSMINTADSEMYREKRRKANS